MTKVSVCDRIIQLLNISCVNWIRCALKYFERKLFHILPQKVRILSIMLLLVQVFWKNLSICLPDQPISGNNQIQLVVIKSFQDMPCKYVKFYRFDFAMDHFVIKKQHILHLFNDQKEMFSIVKYFRCCLVFYVKTTRGVHTMVSLETVKTGSHIMYPIFFSKRESCNTLSIFTCLVM